MASPTLEYDEIQKTGKTVHISFRKICADSSAKREYQTTEKKGMSIVAFFSQTDKEQIRNDIMNKIYDLHYGFVPVKNLHSTLLTIYPSKNTVQEKPNDYFNYLVKDQLMNFFNDQKNNTTLTLKLNEIRPGTWYGLDNRQIPYASNGTLVAIGKPDESGNEEFVTLANELVCHLKNNLGQIFSDDFDRKFPTIWSTLGYFDHYDFDITKKFADTFNKLKNRYSINPLKIAIDEVMLIEYSFKDLRKVKILSTFKI